jgi:hypothetical protein
VRPLIALLLLSLAPSARAADVTASAPQKLSVTIYRAPWRNGGSISLGNLGGFALVTETRLVHLPAGESRLRFEGVVDGIEPASAIVSGLPDGVIEKNRDAAVLSPEALIRAALGAQVTLKRTNPKSGKVIETPAVIRSADDQGVVFETADGVEALKCSGLPETFTFARVPAGLSSTPTLSVLTRATRETTAIVTLSYLANAFDWSANYVAKLAPGGRTLDLGAWITLANGNGVSLPDAHTQIVAGRLNRVGGDDGADDAAPRVIAECWPRDTTTDGLPSGEPAGTVVNEIIVTASRRAGPAPMAALMPPPPPAPPPPPPPEQLGDLKLYRVPEPISVASHQSKQVRLLGQADVPFTSLASADLIADLSAAPFAPATTLLRTRNDLASHLGLPLPSGSVAVFGQVGGRDMLLGEANLRDTAVDEDVELKMGPAPDIQVRQMRISYTANSPRVTALSPELLMAVHGGQSVEEVEITNARDTPVPFELRLQTYGVRRVTNADHPMAMKDGRPIFRLTLPANASVKVHYAVAVR